LKIKIGSIPYVYPIPIVLIGATVEGKPNFETIGDIGLMGINPPLVYTSSGKDHHTNQGILENETFSINFPTTDMLAVVDYCGQVSGRDVDKGALFNMFYGETGSAPMISRCPVNLECRVIKEFSIKHRQIFIAEVVQTYVEETYLENIEGKRIFADLTRLDPIIYALDNRYYQIGNMIGIGYQEAGKLDKNKHW